jgi:hypothetical protein
MFVLSVLTFIAGGFICIAGLYAFIELIKAAYDSGSKSPEGGIFEKIVLIEYLAVGSPFLCYSAPPISGNSTSSG